MSTLRDGPQTEPDRARGSSSSVRTGPAAHRARPGAPLENFIPLRKSDLVALLARQPELAPHERDELQRVCQLTSATLHVEYQQQLDALKDAYAPFDPDADTRPLGLATSGDASSEPFWDRLTELLVRANFRRLSPEDIRAATRTMSAFGLNVDVDFDAFERLDVYARGDMVESRACRQWRDMYRGREIEVPVYQRLVAAFRLREDGRKRKLALPRRITADPRAIHVKLFKNVPHMDVEMLLPSTRVRMSMIDRGRIFLPTLSGLAIMGWKLFQGALLVAYAGVYGMLAFLGLVGGTMGYGVKSFLSYQRTVQKYQHNLTQSLYYLNLDNNAGALVRLVDEADEQETREALLAYYLLWRKAGQAGLTAEELDREVEKFLKTTVNVEIDFEIGDALDKLRRMEIVWQSEDGRLRALPPTEALARLDAAWDGRFGYHAPATSDGTTPARSASEGSPLPLGEVGGAAAG